MTSKQTPINSGFDGATTATQALAGKDLHGMTAIVTGGYSGIGLEAVRTLAGAGAQVIVPARDALKAERNLRGIRGVELASLDLLDAASIDRFAQDFLASGRALHLLINSAGIMATPLQRNANGLEAQFATNHLGHFQLTARLWPALRKTSGARVVAVSSLGHRLSPCTSKIPNLNAVPMTSGWPTVSQKPPTRCSPWRWTSVARHAMCARFRYIPVKSSPTCSVTWTKTTWRSSARWMNTGIFARPVITRTLNKAPRRWCGVA